MSAPGVGPRVGILALQGAAREHRHHLTALGAVCTDIKWPRQLQSVDGLVIPGGESTTIGKLMAATGLLEAIKAAADRGLPVFGTCAGLILMARSTTGGVEHPLGLMDVTVERNAYGRQVASFEAEITGDFGDPAPMKAIFIRAPVIKNTGTGVKTLAAHQGRPVCVEQEHLLACSFHPELTDDLRVHRYFLNKVQSARAGHGRKAAAVLDSVAHQSLE